MKPFWSVEPILRRLRILPIKPHVLFGGVLVDIGCDDPPYLLEKYHHDFDFCIGIDAEVKSRVNGNIEIKNLLIKKSLPIESDLAHTVTMLAVLEHLDHPRAIIQECYRILKPGGILIITVPAPRLKPILNVLAWFHIVRPEMIKQHKNYFSHDELRELFGIAGFRNIHIASFQFGFNTLAYATK